MIQAHGVGLDSIMETQDGVDAGHTREAAAKAGDRRDAHLKSVSMDVELLQPGGKGGSTVRITESTHDMRPKPDLQWI
jgi:hypothetical protein